MRVDGNRPVRPVAGRRGDKAGGVGSGGFAEILGGEPASAAAPATAANAVGGLFALQEVGDALSERRRKALSRAGRLLDRLNELQRGLLEGRIDEAGLADLAATARGARAGTDDPRLEAILDEIELRAAVELAKLSRAI